MDRFKGLLSLKNKFLLCLLVLALPLRADIIKSIEDLEVIEQPEQPEQLEQPKPVEPKKPIKAPEKKPSEPKLNKKRSQRAKAPIRLKSDGKSIYSRDLSLIHLKENVVVTQEDLRLSADEAKVYLISEDSSSQKEDIDRVEMIGQVSFYKFDEIKKEKVTANSDRALFINKKQEIELIGNARIWKGSQLIRGKRMRYDLTTGMIEVDQAVGVMQADEEAK